MKRDIRVSVAIRVAKVRIAETMAALEQAHESSNRIKAVVIAAHEGK